jgi:DNA-binding CsgD family transcriptional regulator
LELLKFVAPHLQRAFSLHLKLAELKTHAGDLEEAIDMVSTGIIFLRANASIVHMNRAAAKIIAENDGLIATHNRLASERPSESGQLQDLIAQAKDISAGKGLRPAGAMAISRRLRQPLQVLITPVRNPGLHGASVVHAMAFVIDPSLQVRPAAEVLRTLFGLTPAECRIALLLCQGHTPPSIADLVGISANTLKSQLASVYRKTGTSRQSQLVRMLSRLVIGPPEWTA